MEALDRIDKVDPLQGVAAATATTGSDDNRRTSDVSIVANGNGNVQPVENGKPYKGYNNLKNIIKRGKNEVSFEETVSLLGGDINPTDGGNENSTNRRSSILSNTSTRSSDNHKQQKFMPKSEVQPSATESKQLLPAAKITANPNCDNTNSTSSDESHSSANNLRFSLPLNCAPADKKDGTATGNSTTYPKKSILSNASQSQCSTSNYKRPPDGGWGWVVVFASFMINLIADGVSLSFGVIYPELVEAFGESKSKTSWVGSLFLSIPLITGPIASALTDHFGCRKVAISGSILASLGFCLGSFSTKIEHLFLAFSLSGFGLALCSVTSIVCVAYYFEKRRSLATGLSVCGTGLGTFLFAPLTIYLLEEFGWRTTLLILSAIFLNIILFGLLIKDLDLEDDSDEESSSEEEDSTSDIESNVIDSEMNSIADEEANFEDESEIERRHQSKLSSALSCHKSRDNSDESLASNHNKRISFSKNARMRHISECEPTAGSMPRTCASLINIPTYIKNAGNKNVNESDSSKPDSGTNDSIGELTFRRGGYLHGLITYYPHLLSLFLPWNLECNDLTVKTVPSKSREKLPTLNTDTSKPNGIDLVKEGKERRSPQVEFETPPPSPGLRSSRDSLSHPHDSLAIPVPDPENYDQLINFRPGRIGAASRLVRGRGHRHRLHQHHLNNDLLGGGNCLHNLRLQRGSLTYRSAMLIISKYKLKASSAPDIYKTSMATINEDKGFTVFDNLKEILCDMVDLSTFKNIPYSIFCLSNFLLYACIDIPYVYLPDQAITSGSFEKEGASLLISIIGVFNTLGVVFIGYIGDKPWLDASMIYAFFIAFSGIALAAIPLTTNSIIVSSLTSIYGFAISANYSLVSVILVEFISLDAFTQAYGLLLLVQGIGSLVGPPIVGWLFDTLGSYSEAFYLTGICVLISGLFVIPVGKRKNCCLWSYKMSRTGSTASLRFKPLNFISKGVYGSNVCTKRNNLSIMRDYHQQQQQRASISLASPTVVVTDEQTTTSITLDSKVPVKNGLHHVVTIDEEDTSGCGASTMFDDEDNCKAKPQPTQNSDSAAGSSNPKTDSCSSPLQIV